MRFPTISAELNRRGLDLATDLIPVAPAAHYFMGGIVAGTDGLTSLPGLLAVGEAACTGVHGANRLASNSLLEGLVFGAQAGAALARSAKHNSSSSLEGPTTGQEKTTSVSDKTLNGLGDRVQRVMSGEVAVVRSADGLHAAETEVDAVLQELSSRSELSRGFWETSNISLAARAVISAAAIREESRGAHYRSDFPNTDPDLAGKHIAFGGQSGEVWRLTSLDDAQSMPMTREHQRNPPS
jgi:L-aspartate oxidase